METKLISNEEIKKRLQPFAFGKVFLFGSSAYGNPKPDSDYDLLLITTHEISDSERIEIKKHIRANFRNTRTPVDLVFLSPLQALEATEWY